MISFTIPYPSGKKAKSAFCNRYGLNAYYAGKHWAARKTDANVLHTLTIAALNRAKIPKKIINEPIVVTFYWDDGLDVDNHAVIGKAVVDALKGNLIADDNRKHFRRVTHDCWDGGSILVEIKPISECRINGRLDPTGDGSSAHP
ncbi:hypothetical protein KL86CLO1_11661 [uncultured Eubacteriales bacterium]|uniref:Uncharacterized protein n=1 Tax=uncultured Eubacteriales bacterium TaxID=172733 RepID=A0A212JSW1_9FIRM|nr:hypothetical protein KL86CLO1_11661 [uncultured Eubacteriales bacterium]